MMLAPFFGSKVLPHPVKVALGLCLFAIFLPVLMKVTTTQVDFNLWFMVLLSKEIFIGFVLGFMISLPFSILQSAGIIIDHQRGGSSLMVNDPSTQSQASPIGLLYNHVFLFIFFTIDGPFLFIDALVTSYEVIPPDQLLHTSFFASTTPFWQTQFHLLNRFMVLTVQMASPGLITILMTDVFLGIVNRLAPQIQITFLGMPLKSLLALTIVCLGWRTMSEQMIIEAHEYLALVRSTILSMGTGGNS
jgi:type III secretion protein SpaR/YscT/HrcT